MQLPLAVQLPVEQQFDTFVAGPNQQLVAHTRSIVEALAKGAQQSFKQLFLHGANGQGKTHLLIALCHYANQLNLENFYISLRNFNHYTPDMLDGFAQIPLLCIDDLDAITDSEQWQVAVFDLINQRRENGNNALVLAANKNLAHPEKQDFSLTLPDLHSRMQWGDVYAYKALDDMDKVALLELLAEARGMKFSERAIQYLLNHCERRNDFLVDAMERLDKRSLQEQRALTVDLIKRELDT
ncbi:DnaA regulatory inactivator Hda [Alteromonas sp. ASW11-36]|uniref:DnaA regulatory inactivator Hda n=1 Tax=Alteromonas arenosi TaxID=3055817 RepID=A0ABT7SX55_9ALTE|nr:DnaA regulatory inactivator Hda [Alteromonas sp. ASW11-36]MDM7860772.1 DnaA regulatory inactivator Hda [Alteromonas sp. ASW11-36]